MAALEITPALAEIISSLTQDDIPAKLRCTICSRLAVNAYRLPCCDQAICEKCHATLPSSCPVCEHSPVSAADCKPNKSLRTTIKVFLRTEEKKREARLKEVKKNTPPATPSEHIASPKRVEDVPDAPAADSTVPAHTVDYIENTQEILDDSEGKQQADQDIPQPSIEEIAPGQEPRPDGELDEIEGGEQVDGDGQTVAGDDGNDQVTAGVNGISGLAMGLGSAGMPGGFPGMGFGDMNQMQQMQMMMSMQNGMAPNAFGGFPMMGMPGMNMDPMAMQQMMMSGGFGGAGMGMNSMNGMNMGMGLGGFEGGVGTGFNNGWNNQQSWNVGQDNYNHQNATGIGHGDYGANNSGYPQSTGYNQGNYGRGNHHNNYQNNNGYHGRGGRGRGAYGRGGYGFGSNEAFSQQYPQNAMSGGFANGTSNETPNVPTEPKANDVPTDPNVDEFGREKRQVSESDPKDVAQLEGTQTPKDNPAAKDTTGNRIQAETTNAHRDASEKITNNGLNHIQTLDDAEAAFNSSYNSYGQNSYNKNGFHGRGISFSAMPPPKPVDVPINAPKGPKAMREGLPNTGISGLKARGFGKAISVPVVNGNASAAPEAAAPIVANIKDKERSISPTRDRSRSRDRKRSRSRDHHHRRHRHRSTSLVDDRDEDTERRRERRKRHRHEDEDEHEKAESSDKAIVDEKKGARIDEDRSRSASASESKRSSHRSRRDKEKYREREKDERDKYRDRDDDREHRSSHKHRSSRRHHEDRSRSRDREHRHRHSRRGSEDADERASKADKSIPPTPVDSEPPSRRPSMISGNTNGLEIKGSSLKRKGTIDDIVIPTGPRGDRNSHREQRRDEPKDRERSSRYHDDDRHRSSRHQHEREKVRGKDNAEHADETERTKSSASSAQDPHTIEREARNRERLLKEAQRMAGLAGGRKRSRDDGDAKGGVKKRGRGHENEEARISRLEEERESARWT